MSEGTSQNFDAAFVDKYATSEYYLSRGANGNVYGPIQWNDMQLAIKHTLFAAGKVTEELKKDIEAKKKILASSEHKHLIRIHSIDLSQLPKAMFIVMEFAAGGSLHDALRSLGGSGEKLRIDVVTDWAKQIAEGMLYLHKKNIVHRDLKSSNILLMEKFDIHKPYTKMILKIADFDEVKDHDRTMTLSFVGTVAYMAPEVIVKQRFSKGSDVWSYGVVIWEMLTGNTPHKGLESNTLIHNAIKGKLDSLKIEESFPQLWKNLLNRCMKPILTQRASFYYVISTLRGLWYFDQDFLNQYATMDYYVSRGSNRIFYGPIQWNDMQLAIKKTTFAAGKVTQKFKRDIEVKKGILASIEHKHLLRIHSFDLRQLPKAMFIAMEFAAGGSLHDALKSLGGSGQKLPIDVVTDWAKQIAEGMLYLHEKNIVHRDLKSSNILLTEPYDIRKPHTKMTLKIADFDEVKDHDHTMTMSLVGTVAYMAPEVITEQRFSKGSDVWSFGVVIWEMLTGDTPHKGLEPNTIIHKAIKGELDSLKIEESFPLLLKQLLNRCFEPILMQRTSFYEAVSIIQAKLKYNSDPVLIHSIEGIAAKETKISINGLAILDNELFVVTLCSSDIEVYDSIELSFRRRMHLKELNYPVDITSCNISKCLYILDVKDFPKTDEILRVDSNAKLIKNWSTGSYYVNAVSITDESNVLVCSRYYRVVKEYSPDGQLISKINLSVDAYIYSIRHAIKLSNGDYLVSCDSGNKEPHKVCIVDAFGKLTRSFSEECGPNSEQIKHSAYLSVDENGFVLVADQFNRRVLLLDSNLTFQREILSKEKHGLQYPSKIVLDEPNGRMIVADKFRILIFQIKELAERRLFLFGFQAL